MHVVATSRPRPSWLVRFIRTTFRIFFLTLLFTCLGMALGLFVGILYTLIAGGLTHTHVELLRAVHNFAIPCAVASGTVAFLWNLGRAVHGAVKRER